VLDNGSVVYYTEDNLVNPYRIEKSLENKVIDYIDLGFENSYKIRLNKDKNEFYSLVGKNLDEINSILKSYNAKILATIDESSIPYFEELERKGRLEDPSYNYISNASQYIVRLDDKTKLKELILKLRTFNFVRGANPDFKTNLSIS
jgi:hypothetical protein